MSTRYGKLEQIHTCSFLVYFSSVLQKWYFFPTWFLYYQYANLEGCSQRLAFVKVHKIVLIEIDCTLNALPCVEWLRVVSRHTGCDYVLFISEEGRATLVAITRTAMLVTCHSVKSYLSVVSPVQPLPVHCEVLQRFHFVAPHYCDVMMSAIASQITSLTIVYSTVYSDADQSKHQSSASLAFVRGNSPRTGDSPHKWSVTRKVFLFDDVIMSEIFKTILCVVLSATSVMELLWCQKWGVKVKPLIDLWF